MRVFRTSLVIKALQSLLIARVLAAPVALLAQGGGESLATTLVVRSSAWAAHQSRLTARGAGEHRATCAEIAPPAFDDFALAASPPGRSAPVPAPLSSHDAYSRRSIARLRC